MPDDRPNSVTDWLLDINTSGGDPAAKKFELSNLTSRVIV